MIPVRKKISIQIEVTNACVRECTNCSRLVGHYRNTYFMSLEQIEKAIDSLQDFPGKIGIMGGEPLLHPDFAEICRMVKQKVPPAKRHLWTSGYNWDKYRRVVRKTFGENISFNDHRDTTQKHHPMLLSISDIIHDQELIRQMIDDCWVNNRWSASINPKGAFFCEIAAVMDVLFEGPGGHPVKHGWWNKNPDDFRDQIERYCYRCGACVPYIPVTLEEMDVASISNYVDLNRIGSPKFNKKKVRLHKEELSQQQLEELALNWQPWNHLGNMEKEGQGKSEYDMYGKLYGYFLKFKQKMRSHSWTFKKAELAADMYLWRLQAKRPAEPERIEVNVNSEDTT